MKKIINEFDQIARWPKKPSDKKDVIIYLATKFDYEKIYTEKEVNDIISRYHLFENIALLRRELVSKRMLSREDDGSKYWRIN